MIGQKQSYLAFGPIKQRKGHHFYLNMLEEKRAIRSIQKQQPTSKKAWDSKCIQNEWSDERSGCLVSKIAILHILNGRYNPKGKAVQHITRRKSERNTCLTYICIHVHQSLHHVPQNNACGASAKRERCTELRSGLWTVSWVLAITESAAESIFAQWLSQPTRMAQSAQLAGLELATGDRTLDQALGPKPQVKGLWQQKNAVVWN